MKKCSICGDPRLSSLEEWMTTCVTNRDTHSMMEVLHTLVDILGKEQSERNRLMGYSLNVAVICINRHITPEFIENPTIEQYNDPGETEYYNNLRTAIDILEDYNNIQCTNSIDNSISLPYFIIDSRGVLSYTMGVHDYLDKVGDVHKMLDEHIDVLSIPTSQFLSRLH